MSPATLESRVGSITGAWDHFKEWKRIESEDEAPRVSLEVILRGICDKTRLLDITAPSSVDPALVPCRITS